MEYMARGGRRSLMKHKIDNALNKLNAILPLKSNQESCDPEIKLLHQAILNAFVNLGRILTLDEMKALTSDLETAVNTLKEKDMVVFSESKEPIGAYPFTMEAREHEVMVSGNTVHAMCALDALSVAPMFDIETRVSSSCRVTQSPVTIEMEGETIKNPQAVDGIRFGILWGAADSCSCCADSLCTEMIFLKDQKIAEQWLANDPANREIFTLQEAVEFGSRFFAPLMS